MISVNEAGGARKTKRGAVQPVGFYRTGPGSRFLKKAVFLTEIVKKQRMKAD